MTTSPTLNLAALKAARLAAAKSQEALGLEIGTRKTRAQAKISGIECGRIGCSQATLERIAAALGVSAASLTAKEPTP